MLLYHYTSDSNFKRILENKKLSFTRSTSSNDLYDTVYIETLLKKNIDTIFSNVKLDLHDMSLDIFYRLIIDIFKDRINDLKSNNSANSITNKCFVLCFTEKKDSRFLWDSYTNDKGVAIGIDQNEFKKYLYSYTSKPFFEYKFDQVIYETSKQIKILRKISTDIFSRTFKDIDKLSGSSSIIQQRLQFDNNDEYIYDMSPFQITIRQWIIDFMNQYIYDLLKIAPFIKHPFWKEENEYRLCLYRPIAIDGYMNLKKFERTVEGISENKQTVEYLELDIKDNLFKEIIIGPLSLYRDKNEFKMLNIKEDDINIVNSKGTGIKVRT